MEKIKYILCGIVLFLSLFTSYSMSGQAEKTNSIIWSVTVNCGEAGGTSDSVTFGEAPDANDGPPADSYDVAKPPAPPTSPYVRLWFNDSLPAPYSLLMKDYRHYPDTEKVWNLTVHWMPSSGSSPTSVTLNWSIDEVSASEYISMNFCDSSGTPLKDMRLNNNYNFNCPAYIPQFFKIICVVNHPPATPQKPSGETSGKIGVQYTYTTTTVDPDSHQVYYQWDWGDGTISDWLGPSPSGQITESTHTWTKKGNYQIRIKAKDVYGAETNWSESLPITMPISQMDTINEIFIFLFQIIRSSKTEYAGMIFFQNFKNGEIISSFAKQESIN